MIQLRLPRLLLTSLTVLCLAAAFVWIGYEDQSTGRVSLLGACGASLAVLLIAERRYGRRPLAPRQWLMGCMSAGLLGGLATGPLVIVLMALKVSLHGHAVPDFSPQDVLAVLATIPIWGGAGFLLGGAVGLIGLARAKA